MFLYDVHLPKEVERGVAETAEPEDEAGAEGELADPRTDPTKSGKRIRSVDGAEN
jgi:hypothetical protein